VDVKNIRERFESFKIDDVSICRKPTPKARNVIFRSKSTRDSTTINHRKRQVISKLLPTDSQTEERSMNSYKEIITDSDIRPFPREQFRQKYSDQGYYNMRPFPPPKPPPRFSISASVDSEDAYSLQSFDSSNEDHYYCTINEPPSPNAKVTVIKTHSIIQELLDNEKRYIEVLKNGVNDYIVPFSNLLLPKSLVGKRLSIFSNIEVILEFHETRFYPRLLECGYDPEKIATTFSDFIIKNKFDNYIFYVKNRANSDKICHENKYFFMQLQKDRLGINSFLLQPVQRLPRYQLMLGELVKDLMKNLDKNKEAIARCCEAEKGIQKLLNIVNDYCE